MVFASVITLLLLSNEPAYAEWVSIDSSDSFTIYVDPDSLHHKLRHKGKLVKIWVLFDFKAVQGTSGSSYISEKLLDEFDCTEEQYRILAFYRYSGPMGTGEFVYSDSYPGKWEPVARKTVNQSLWVYACDKK
jgi:hypothetical protein